MNHRATPQPQAARHRRGGVPGRNLHWAALRKGAPGGPGASGGRAGCRTFGARIDLAMRGPRGALLMMTHWRLGVTEARLASGGGWPWELERAQRSAVGVPDHVKVSSGTEAPSMLAPTRPWQLAAAVTRTRRGDMRATVDGRTGEEEDLYLGMLEAT